MNMKKYIADTMVDAMKKVRADFGDDAIILSSNVVKSKGFLGLFKKKSVEVVAGYDRPAMEKEMEMLSVPNPARPHVHPAADELREELLEMKKMIHLLQPSVDISRYPDDMHPLLQHLQRQSLCEDFVITIGDGIFNKMKAEKKDFTISQQCEIARKLLKEEIGDALFGGITFQKKYINVLGPTGVGKTTTIAKIAARALLERKQKIGFITTDTYRIAAIEQLRTYANLLQAPVEVAYNRQDFNRAIEKLSHLDLVFIDTAGRNYKDAKFVDDLTELIDFSLEMESYLVLSVTSKQEDMEVILERFNVLPIEKFIFTKMDETSSIGPIFNLMKKYSIGTAYYTDGQEVPEDLVETDLEKLINLLLDGVANA